MLTPDQEAQLTGQAECFIHFHNSDPLSQSDGAELQSAANQYTATGNYVVTSKDDYILCDTSSSNITVTLPPAENGREYEVVKTASANTVTILPTSPDTILWATGATISSRGTAIRFKATTGNWIAI